MKRKRSEENSKPTEVPEAKRMKKLYNGLWMSNLPQHITESKLNKYVEELGTISKIVFFCDTSRSVKNNTFAGILYDGKIADDALDYDGALILNSKIKLRYLKESDYTVYLSGVNMKTEELKEILEEAGKVKEIKKEREEEYKIVFEKLQDIENVLKYSGSDIHGRVINIRYQNLEEDNE